jgi:hypothetical protein
MAVVAPIPRAMERIAIPMVTGDLRIERSACFTSFKRFVIRDLDA